MRSALAVVLIGCGGGSGGLMVDTPQGDDDAPILPDAPTERCDQLAGGMHKLFLAFDGVTLAMAAPSDATMNQASYAGGTVPIWRPTDPDRAGSIRKVVCTFRAALAAYSVDVVTTRPTTGAYEMIVFGGSAQDLALQNGTQSVTATDCSNINAKDVAWTQDTPGQEPEVTAVAGLAMVGANHGLDASSDPLNCACQIGSGTGCNFQATSCTFSTTAPIRASDRSCTGNQVTMQDQDAALSLSYGPR